MYAAKIEKKNIMHMSLLIIHAHAISHHAHVFVSTCACARIYVRVCFFMCACAYTRKRTSACMCARHFVMHVCVCARTCVCAYACMCGYMFLCARTYRHMHAQACATTHKGKPKDLRTHKRAYKMTPAHPTVRR